MTLRGIAYELTNLFRERIRGLGFTGNLALKSSNVKELKANLSCHVADEGKLTDVPAECEYTLPGIIPVSIDVVLSHGLLCLYR